MAKFLSDLIVRQLSGDDLWQLESALKYKSDIVGYTEAPAGFVTDFASVPRLPIAYLFAGNIAHEAAVVHDFLYQTHPCTKMQADRTFREAMEVTGIHPLRRNLMFAAVVSCGWIAWAMGPRRFKKLN